MGFRDRMKDAMGQGLHVSREFMSKAGAKAQDLGAKGVLKLEIAQLQGQAQKMYAALGREAYASFSEKGFASISAEDPIIKGMLSEISSIRDAIDQKEQELNASRS